MSKQRFRTCNGPSLHPARHLGHQPSKARARQKAIQIQTKAIQTQTKDDQEKERLSPDVKQWTRTRKAPWLKTWSHRTAGGQTNAPGHRSRKREGGRSGGVGEGKRGGKRHSNSIPIAWPSHAEGPDARPANQGTKGDKAHKGHDPFSLVLSRSGESVLPADYQAGLRKGRSLGVWLARCRVCFLVWGRIPTLLPQRACLRSQEG